MQVPDTSARRGPGVDRLPDGAREAADAGADRGHGVPRAVRARGAGDAGLRGGRVRRVRGVRRLRRVPGLRRRRRRALLRLLPPRAVPRVTPPARGDSHAPYRSTMNLVPNVYNTIKKYTFTYHSNSMRV